MRHKLHKILPLILCLGLGSNIALAQQQQSWECNPCVNEKNIKNIIEHVNQIGSVINEHSDSLTEHEKEFQTIVTSINEHADSLNEHEKEFQTIATFINKYADSLNEHEKEFQTIATLINEHADSLNDQVNILDEHKYRLDEQDSALRSHSAQLDSHELRINGNNEKINKQDARLDKHADRLDDHDEQLDDHDEQLEDHNEILAWQEGRLDSHDTKLDIHDAIFDDHATQLYNHDTELDIHGTRLDDHAVQLQGHNDRLDTHQIRMNSMTAEYKQQFAIHKDILDTHTNDISNLNSRVDSLSTDLGRVGAGAAALAALHPLDFDPDAKWDVAAALGRYNSHSAVALGTFYRPTENIQLNLGCTVGNGKNMINLGASFKLDGKKRGTRTKTAMAREIIDLRTQLEMLTAKVDGLSASK